mmetsp:Transcript_20778/g.29874  ORF Transcript_20778/g.29874 Transcript_20778/m.29874 type:complete len:1773 (+) Transcript_20778:103-5421(+)|eukprot:CAMPEP_0185023328 /NCGR_PEP_ID=MMETSP1103-20130426/6014_1 /TAXON_ID=36769 /ORGANISM="Paraphysomonas bandaiensis, Strain Caron Lab Isolate" /LENGTH=1772 /DNA_ID=CAMNT_0027555879 /DNA_START=101 /DNA_END=5419 /DNA_ORIENTATION=-
MSVDDRSCKSISSASVSWRSMSWRGSSKSKFIWSKSTTDVAHNTYAEQKHNSKAVKEFKAQTSITLQESVLRRIHLGKVASHVFCETVFASVLLADISGFTKLASTLDVEDLKRHINNFFTILLGNIIRKHKGDVVKFCGDAVLVMWTAPLSASPTAHSSCVECATECGLDMLSTCGQYDSGSKDAPVSLRLHCGMSAGRLHYMSLGSTERMEFLVSGPLLAEMGAAEASAKTGEICLSPTAFTYICKKFDGITTSQGSVRIMGKRKIVKQTPSFSSFFTKKHVKIYIDTSPNADDKPTAEYAKFDTLHRSAIMNALPVVAQPKEFKKMLARFVNQSVREAIAKNTSEHIAELRLVTTMFIQLFNLDEDFNSGRITRPQQALLTVLDSMKRLQGSLRQYVVDDKGCVIICCFGVPGFSSSDDSVRAITSAFRIRADLSQFDIQCRIGIAQGTVFCGYVGSIYRHEYAVMGSSVNLAARLMGKCDISQILVDSNVHYDARDEFTFKSLPRVKAKGYDRPVAVFSPQKHAADTNTSDDTQRRFDMNKRQKIVGRRHELSLLSSALRTYLINSLNTINDELFHSEASASIASPCSQTTRLQNKFVIVGGPGYGKSALITELIRKNSDLLYRAPRLYCHLANMMEPYEVIRQLFKLLLGHDVEPVIKRSSRTRRHSKTFFQDRYSSKDNDDQELDLAGADVNEDYEEHLLEDMYVAIETRVRTYLSTLTFDYVCDEDTSGASGISNKEAAPHTDNFDSRSSSVSSKNSIARSGNTVSSKSSRCSKPNSGSTLSGRSGMSESRDVPLGRVSGKSLSKSVLAALEGSSCLYSGDKSWSLSYSDKLSTATPNGIDVAANTTVFTIHEVLPLLRVCFGTAAKPPVELLDQFSATGKQEMICSLASEIIKHYIYTSSTKTLIMEDLQWCDSQSFEIILRLLSVMDSGIFLGSMRPVDRNKKSRNWYVHNTSFDRSARVNDMDDISYLCHVISLGTFTRNSVRSLIEVTLGSSVLANEPNILSDQSVTNILSKSGGGIAGLVVEQIKQIELRVSKMKYGASSPSSGNRYGMQEFDGLSHENKILLKLASVCGTDFSVYTLNLTLEKMGYGVIISQVEKALVELEEMGIIKRVFAMPERLDTTVCVSYLSKTRSSSTRRMVSQCSGVASARDSKSKLYTFLNKAFRENIYALMLEGQRQAVHDIIALDLAEMYALNSEEMRVSDAEALAFHFSRARNLQKEIEYTEVAAEKSQIDFLFLASYSHYHQLLKLATCQCSVDQVIEDCCANHHTLGDSFSGVLSKPYQFGKATANRRYLARSELSKRISSKCKLIPTYKMCIYVAHMSILSYKLGELARSHNLCLLAVHMNRINNSVLKIPFRSCYESNTIKNLYAEMFFYHGDLCMTRGLLSNAEVFYLKSLSLTPSSDLYSRARLCSGLATASLFSKGMAAAQSWYKLFNVNAITDRKDTRYSYIQLHRGVLVAATGEFQQAEVHLLNAATRTVLKQDDSPLRLQIENIISWIHFVCGHPQQVHDRVKLLAECDLTLQKIWSNEIMVAIHIMRGQFVDAYHVLNKIKRLQKGHYGMCYYYALYGFLSVCGKKFLHTEVMEREKCLNAIAFAGEKLIQRPQICPMGIISLFLVAYSAQILLSYDDCNLQEAVVFRQGGGMRHRLQLVAKHTLDHFRTLVPPLPFLKPLDDALLMCTARSTKVLCNRFTVEYFEKSSLHEDYKQFAFGLLFWNLEKQKYMRDFNINIDEGEEESGSHLNYYLSMYDVPKHHPFFNR